MSNSSSVYLIETKNFFSFVTQEKKNNRPKWTKSSIKKTQTIKKIVCGDESPPHFLVWKKPNKLEFYQKYNKKRKYQLPKNETIKDIASSCFSYLILTESGKVWSLADMNNVLYKEIPLLDANQSTFEEIRPVTFFEEKKLFVNSVVMGCASGYYLCNGDQLYASGSNDHGNLGIGQYGGEEPMPVYVQDKVTKIFSGSAPNFFFTTIKPDLLYSCGSNYNGELGIGSTVEKISPTVVQNIKGSEILTLTSGDYHSILINKEGQTFGCGRKETNGHGVQKTVFTLIPQLKEKKAVQLAIGSNQTLVLTDQNELYGWGFDEYFQIKEDKENNQRFPTKIKLPGFFTKYLDSKDQIRIACEPNVSFLYLDFSNTLLQDLRILYKSQKFCDCEIGTLGNQFPVHKALVECRTKLKIDQIQNKLFGEKSINKEQTLNFLKWIYYDEISDLEKLEQTFNLLELTFPPSVDNTLEKDIAQLYKDDDSKDFKILVKNDDEEDEDEEDNYEEIPVHKFILLARSGLFREMFDNANEKDNLNEVQDYTNKSIENLNILIKYFYTNSIEMTADQDPELIVDELSDAVEYYQLNDQSNLVNEILKIKKQFELN
ncbi:regulator of chromosome condensation [Anaeramoeba flamelloides]|uniref:Regulator of chromosome condensation n=1 Tax=Anaeramoeba flamelloides TaxID=1746091 RepID=A0ABQ8Z621_9EUKA|nr:regulator of chromosome condensation [Anaeramoeba flamelloides]